MKYGIIFWDWNGTLLDDEWVSYDISNLMLSKRNLPMITKEEYYSQIQTPITKFYEFFFDTQKEGIDNLLYEYSNEYMKLSDKISLAPYAVECLQKQIADKGKNIILSACERGQIIELIEKLGVRKYFDDILGSKSILADGKIERAKKFVADNNIDTKKALLVGDTLHDLDVANAVGCDCILVEYGHDGKNKVGSYGCKTVENLKELYKML